MYIYVCMYVCIYIVKCKKRLLVRGECRLMKVK